MSITKEEWRAMKSLGDEATKVTTFLQRRGHNPDEACAVMGVALAQLIDNRGMLESFIEALRAEYRIVRGLVRLAAVLLTLLLLASVAALSVLSTSVAYAADESDPPLPRFRPWQQVWQCNDIRVTVTARDSFSIEYDLGGTIWGGSRFTVVKGELFFNGRPCLSLQPVGY